MTPTEPSFTAVRARYPVRSIEVAGQAWTVQDTGAGAADGPPPLVLLPGALGTGEVFWRVLDALGASRRVLALGFPPLPSASALAASLAGLLDALQLARVDLLGTSLGGYVAQAFALAHPQRIRRLVLANTFHDPRLQQARWPAVSEYAKQEPADILAAARRQLADGAEPTARHTELKRLMLELVGCHQDAHAVRAMRLAVLTAEELPKVPIEEGRIALIDDSADPVIAEETRRQLRQRYAAARHFDIRGGGHFPANLQPQTYIEAIVAATA
jgi:pimeloyl-ACP methyl ester carboxylesterase